MIVSNRREVEFYTHIVATTKKTGLHVVGFGAMAKGHF